MPAAYCPKCGMYYTPGESHYCGKCGARLPSVNIVKELDGMENEVKRDYESLRFTASLIVFLGWMVILFGFFAAMVSYAALENVVRELLPKARGLGWLPAVSLIAFAVLQGIVIIASGQAIHSLVDIRHDTRISSRLLRLVYLAVYEKQKPPPNA